MQQGAGKVQGERGQDLEVMIRCSVGDVGGRQVVMMKGVCGLRFEVSVAGLRV